LQLVVTLGRRQVHYAVLVAPASAVHDRAQRIRQCRVAVARTLKLVDAEVLAPLCERLVSTRIPASTLWLGVGFTREAVTAQLELRRDASKGAERRLRSWLAAELGSSRGADAIHSALGGPVRVQAAGVRGRDAPSTLRVSAVWRPTRDATLLDLGPMLVADARFNEFVALLLPDANALSMRSIAAGASMSITTGALTDVRLELCACSGCVPRDAGGWLRALLSLANAHGLVTPPLDVLLDRTDISSVAFVLDGAREAHLELRVQAPTR
jgi:hypothetical protein